MFAEGVTKFAMDIIPGPRGVAWAIFDGLKPMELADLSNEVLLAVEASVNEETSITPSPESAPPAKKAMKVMKSMKAAKAMKATTGTAASTELTDASKEELREKHKNIGCSKCRKKKDAARA